MATVGYTTKPTYGSKWTGLNTLTQWALKVTMPGGGPWKITRLGVWSRGKDASARAVVAVWSDSAGSPAGLLGSSSEFTMSGASLAIANNLNYEADVSTPIVVNGGTAVWIGMAHHPSDAAQMAYNNTGTIKVKTATTGWPTPITMSGASTDPTAISSNGTQPGFYAYYEQANTAPNAPTLTSPANGARVVGTTPTLAFTGSDPDSGDSQLNYDLQVSTDQTFSSVTHWNITAQTTGQTGFSVSRTFAGTALTRGATYYWRARTTDVGGLTGAWSSARSFIPNELPTIGTRTPASTALATIHNLATDLTTWTLGGSHAKPRLSFVYNDAGSQQMSAYQVRLYNDNAGAQGTLLWDSSKTASVATASSTVSVDSSQALVLGTQYWWDVQVWDSLDEGSGVSTATKFKVRWGQAIYEFNAGGTSSGWAFSSTNPANGTAAFLFRTATGAGGAGAGAWVTSISSLTPAAYLNVLVRLANSVAGTNVTLPDMTFSYLGGATTPDRWSASAGTIVLDFGERRFGSKSLKVTTPAATMYAYGWQYENLTQNDIDVLAGRQYTWSIYVKTSGTLTTGVRLAVYQQGTSTYLVDGATGQNVVGSLITDTSAYADGWQRLSLSFTVRAGVSKVRPVIEYAGSTSGQVFWVDAAQMEEGAWASQWRPGLVGSAVTIDASGLQIDGLKGGIMRLRGSAGGARDTVELGANGLLFGGDTVLYSSATDTLRTDDEIDVRRAAVGNTAYQNRVTGDANARFVVMANGTLNFGGGSGSTDTNLYRSAANTLKTDDALVVLGDFTPSSLLASTVDDGTDTLTISGGGTATFSARTVEWIKIGRLVVCKFVVTVSGNGSGATNVSATAATLPTPATTSTVWIDRGGTGIVPVALRLSSSGFTNWKPLTTGTSLTGADLVSGAGYNGTFCYVASS